MTDFNAELRFYEILYTKMLHQFHAHYKLDKLKVFLEMLSYISEADTMQISMAMQRILTNDPAVKINRTEYIVCLKLFTSMTDVQIRKLIKCSPNTIGIAMNTYESGNLYIHPCFDLMQSHEIRKVMKTFKQISLIY